MTRWYAIRLPVTFILFLFMAGVTQAVDMPLESAQELALKENQMVQSAQAQVKRAEAIKLQTWGGHLPSIRISEGVMRSNDAVHVFGYRLKQEQFAQSDFAINTLNSPQARTNYQTKIEIQQPIFSGGAAISSKRQADAGVQIARAEYAHIKNQIKMETAKAYWAVVLAKEALLAVRQGLNTAREHARLVDASFQQDRQTV